MNLEILLNLQIQSGESLARDFAWVAFLLPPHSDSILVLNHSWESQIPHLLSLPLRKLIKSNRNPGTRSRYKQERETALFFHFKKLSFSSFMKLKVWFGLTFPPADKHC